MKKFVFDLDSIKSMGGAEYARSEAWDISNASQAINLIASMAMNEVSEPDDIQSLGNIIVALMEFINGEIKEMIAAARRGKQEEADAASYRSATFSNLKIMDSEGNVIDVIPAQIPSEWDKKNATVQNSYYGPVKFSTNEDGTVTIPAQVRSVSDSLDLSYVKSLGVEIPEAKLAVKYVSKNTIAHPVFIWGDAKKTDLEREFFTRESDFWDEALKEFARPLTWEHGQDERFAKFEDSPVIGKTVKFYDDDIARWAESVITTDKQYRKYIDQFIEEKRLGYSSDSAPQYVIREKQGKAVWLKSWPWFGGSLTVAPCEPRMKVYTPEFLKSLGLVKPDTETWTHEMAILDYYKLNYS